MRMAIIDLNKFNITTLSDFIVQQIRYDAIAVSLYCCVKLAKQLGIKYIFLFGSSAEGTALYDSDIDILLLTDGSFRHSYISDLLEDIIELELPKGSPAVEIVCRKLDTFIDTDSDLTGFNASVMRTMKLLWRCSDGI